MSEIVRLAGDDNSVAEQQWSPEKANDWYGKQPWLFGFNFVPSTVVNDTEMWQAETFDPKTIDRELAWAHGLGYNSCRVFIQYIVWKQDPAGFKKRFDQFLAIAAKHGISTCRRPSTFPTGSPAWSWPYTPSGSTSTFTRISTHWWPTACSLGTAYSTCTVAGG